MWSAAARFPGRLWRARRRVGIVGIGAVVAALVAATWGICTASAVAPLGPHEARYDVTLTGVVVVDFGPLGTLRVDSQLPARLGVHIVVGEIPAGVTEIDPNNALGALSVDAQRYVQFFADPQTSIDVAKRALIHNAIVRAVVAWLVLMVAPWLVGALLGHRRRRELAEAVRPRARRVVALTIAAVAGVLSLTASGPAPFSPQVTGELATVFDSTPLAGARVTGRLAGVIDTYGRYAVKAYRDNQDFYARAEASFESAWQVRAAVLPYGAPIDTQGETAPVTLLMVSDLHCNTGMAALIRRAAQLSGASIIVNAGDSTIDGTAVESACVDAFARAAPSGVRTVVVDGNHDSDLTAEQERAAGDEVLTGKSVTIKGITFLGAPDPRATRIGVGTTQVGLETATDLADRLATVACDAGHVDVLLIHDPSVGTETLDRGCASLQLSGHLHQRIGPEVVGHGVLYVNASTAGAVDGQPTIGPLHGIAEMTVLRFDPKTHQPLDRLFIRVFPDGHAEVGYPVFLPAADLRFEGGSSPTATLGATGDSSPTVTAGTTGDSSPTVVP